MAFDPVSAIFGIAQTVIERIWPDPTVAAQAKLELAKMQMTGEFNIVLL